MSCDTAGAPREAEATGATASTSAIALTNRSVFFIYLPLQCGCQADPFPDGLVPSGRKAPRSPFHRGPAILFHRRRAVNTRRKSPWRSLVSDTIRPTTDRSSQAQAGSPTGAPPWSPPSGSCPPPRPAGKAGPVWVVSGMCPEHLSGMCPDITRADGGGAFAIRLQSGPKAGVPVSRHPSDVLLLVAGTGFEPVTSGL